MTPELMALIAAAKDFLAHWDTRSSIDDQMRNLRAALQAAEAAPIQPAPGVVVVLPMPQCPDRVAQPSMEHYTSDYATGWNDALQECEEAILKAGICVTFMGDTPPPPPKGKP